MSAKRKGMNEWFKLLLGISIAFAILLVFGVVCTASKFASVNGGYRNAVFGMYVMEVNDNSSEAYPFYSKVVVKNASADDIKVGDYVAFGAINYYLNRNNFGKVESINGDEIVISCDSDGSTQTVNADNIVAALGTTNATACGFVSFLLSDWILWLFVIIPCVALIAIILVWLWYKLSASEAEDKAAENSENSENIEVEAADKDEEKTTTSKTTKKKKGKEKSAEQLEDSNLQTSGNTNEDKNGTSEEKASIDTNADSKPLLLENGTTQQLTFNLENEPRNPVPVRRENIRVPKTKSKDDNSLLVDKKSSKRSKAKEPKLKKVPIAPPKAKRQGDDYIYRKLPTTDTNTPIKEMLDKITNEQENDDKKALLDKMKKQ